MRVDDPLTAKIKITAALPLLTWFTRINVAGARRVTSTSTDNSNHLNQRQRLSGRYYLVRFFIIIKYGIGSSFTATFVTTLVRSAQPDFYINREDNRRHNNSKSSINHHRSSFEGNDTTGKVRNSIVLSSEMGLSSLPDPGILHVIILNTAYCISIFKAIVRSILNVIGVHLSTHFESIEFSSESYDSRLPPSEFFKEEFRKQVPSIQFGSVLSCNSAVDEGCLICLTGFEHQATVSHLGCGHVFHEACLEKWMDYWNITCPLCRTPLVPADVDAE